jgi:hypothetical protein
VQLTTPDALRGRVSAVNMIFINASNQLGAVESGFLAAATSATFAVVFGGIGCLLRGRVHGVGAARAARYRIGANVSSRRATDGTRPQQQHRRVRRRDARRPPAATTPIPCSRTTGRCSLVQPELRARVEKGEWHAMLERAGLRPTQGHVVLRARFADDALAAAVARGVRQLRRARGGSRLIVPAPRPARARDRGRPPGEPAREARAARGARASRSTASSSRRSTSSASARGRARAQLARPHRSPRS